MDVKEFEEVSKKAQEKLNADLEKKFADLKGDHQKEIEALKEEHKKSLEGLQTKEAVEKAVKEAEEKMQNQFDELATKMNKQTTKKEVKSFEDEVAEKKDDIKNLVKGLPGKEIEIKADTLRASISGNTDALKLPGIGRYGRKSITLYELFPKMPVGSGDHNGVIRYHDWDEATTVSAAAAVAEGAVFPESTAKFQEYTLPIRKIGDTLPVSEEFGEDAVSAAAELSLFVATNVESKVGEQIVTGDNTGQNLKGLKASVPTFTAVAQSFQDANIYDLVKQVRTDIVKDRGSKYQPDFVAMSSVTKDKLELDKDANNQYLFGDRDSIGSMRIVEDNHLTDGEIIVGDSRYARIYEMGGIELSKGQPNAQFNEDMATIKARKRLAFLIRNVDQSGFRYVADADAALATMESAPV